MQLLQTAEFENYEKQIQSHRSPNKQNVVHLKKKKMYYWGAQWETSIFSDLLQHTTQDYT